MPCSDSRTHTHKDTHTHTLTEAASNASKMCREILLQHVEPLHPHQKSEDALGADFNQIMENWGSIINNTGIVPNQFREPSQFGPDIYGYDTSVP